MNWFATAQWRLFEYTSVAALGAYLAASERQPGQTDTIARALLRLKGIISAKKQQIR